MIRQLMKYLNFIIFSLQITLSSEIPAKFSLLPSRYSFVDTPEIFVPAAPLSNIQSQPSLTPSISEGKKSNVLLLFALIVIVN